MKNDDPILDFLLGFDMSNAPTPLKVMQQHLRCSTLIEEYLAESDYSEECLETLTQLNEVLEMKVKEAKDAEE